MQLPSSLASRLSQALVDMSPGDKIRPLAPGFDRLAATLAATDPATKTFLRAFALGYSTSVLPQLLKTIIPLFLSRKSPSSPWSHVVYKLAAILWRNVFALNSMGLACGISLGGGKWGEAQVEPVVRRIYRFVQARRDRLGKGKGTEQSQDRIIKALSTLVATTLSSLVGITLLSRSSRSVFALQSVTEELALEPVFLTSPYPSFTSPDVVPAARRSSKTLDLTLFFLVRALDTLVRGAYEAVGEQQGSVGNLLKWIAARGDALVFGVSCSRIMWW